MLYHNVSLFLPGKLYGSDRMCVCVIVGMVLVRSRMSGTTVFSSLRHYGSFGAHKVAEVQCITGCRVDDEVGR